MRLQFQHPCTVPRATAHRGEAPPPGKREPRTLKNLDPDVCRILVRQLVPGPTCTPMHVANLCMVIQGVLLLNETGEAAGRLHEAPAFPDGFVVLRALVNAGFLPVRCPHSGSLHV